MSEFSVVVQMPAIASDRFNRAMDILSLKNPDLPDSVYLTFMLQLGLREVERLYQIAPPPSSEPVGSFSLEADYV